MRIGVNTIHLVPGSGEEDQFLRNALAALRAANPAFEFVLFTDPLNDDSFGGWTRVCLGQADRESRASGIESMLRQAVGSARVERLLSPLVTAPAKCPVPVVAFEIELELLEESESAGHWWGGRRQKDVRRAAQKAAVIVAPTEYARKRLLQSLGIPLDKVVVSRPGVDHLFTKAQPCAVEKPFFLTVGQTHAYRNFERLLKVFERLQTKLPHNLVVVGEAGDAEPSEWGPRVLRINHCPADKLAGLYQHCDLAIFPAIDAVSGIEVLEAMYCEARVMAGKVGAVPEVARSAPFYCDPTNVPAMISTVLYALEESEIQRQHRIKSGRQIAAEYTWARCAERLLLALKR